MSRVNLISEQYLRDNFEVSDSIQSKSVITAVQEAQTFHLASVIGDKFLNEFYNEVENHTLTDVNKNLLDTFIKPFLGAQVMAILTSKISFKVGNQGVTKSQEATNPKQLVDYYNNLAGIALRRLTDHLCQHYALYQQWLDGVEGIRRHIDASVDTGIWLGRQLHSKYPVDYGKKFNR